MSLKGISASLWLALACMAPAQGAGDAYLWSLRYMLINGDDDPTLFAPTEEIARYSALRTPEMHELLAEVLANIRAKELPAQEAALNIVRILAASPEAGRYRTLIADQRKFLTGKGHTAFISRYLAAHPKPKLEQFSPGMTDIAALRKQFVDAALMARPSAATEQALVNLRPDASLDKLFAYAGTPAHVLPRDTRAARKFANVDVRQMVFYYRGVGRISYELAGDTWKPLVLDLDPLAFEDQMPYRRDAPANGQPDDARLHMIQLLSGRPYAIRISAIAVHRLEAAPGEYLDTAAELLLQTHAQARDDMTVDAYSWLCNTLNQHGARRYAAVLARVAQETSEPKLKRYASKVALPTGVKQPAYVPGTVSLGEQKSRYPSPYLPAP